MAISANVKVLCVCGGIVARTVGITLKLNRITAVDFSTSTAITQNTCYALVAGLFSTKLQSEQGFCSFFVGE